MEQDRTSNEETYLRVPGTDQQRLQENTVSVASFTGAALAALMPLQAAQAYGDADSLAAKKKGKKEKLKVDSPALSCPQTEFSAHKNGITSCILNGCRLRKQTVASSMWS